MAKLTKRKKNRGGYRIRDFVSYPYHGIGKITSIVTQMIDGVPIKFFEILFELNQMIVLIPVKKAHTSRMRPIASEDDVKKALEELKAKQRTSHGHRLGVHKRLNDLHKKIMLDGSLIGLAEVVRDLHYRDGNNLRLRARQLFFEELALIADVGEHKIALDVGQIIEQHHSRQ